MRNIILGGGLDQTTPKALVPLGSLEDCYNYEVGIQPGYQPREGFERFDGRMSPSVRDIWDVTIANAAITPSYLSKSMSLTAQDTEPQSAVLSPDGHNMYSLGSTNDTVYQYFLSVAWDLSTAIYVSRSDLISAETTSPTSLAFSADGSKMYVASATTVYQYTLSAPWNLLNSSYASKSATISVEENATEGIALSDDGTQLYAVGTQNDTVYQYTMTSAWDLSTAAYASKSAAIPAAETAVTGVRFASSGTKMYILGTTLGKVHQFTLATAWDVSTATDDQISFDVSVEDNLPRDLFFAADDLQFYVTGGQNDTLYQYAWAPLPNENLSWVDDLNSGDLGVVISTTIGATETVIRFAYWLPDDRLTADGVVTGDVSGTTFTNGFTGSAYTGKSLDVSGQETGGTGLFVKPDGLKVYVLGGNDTVYQYDLTLAYDMSTAAYATKSFLATGEQVNPRALAFSSDGTKMYVFGWELTAYQYTLSPAWDVGTAVYASKSLFSDFQVGQGQVIRFSTDGTEVYLSSATEVQDNSDIKQFTLSTAWDISTATFTAEIKAVNGTAIQGIDGISFSSDGLTLYLIDDETNAVHRLNLSTAWDISTAAVDGVTFSVNAEDGIATDVHFVGNYFYVLGDLNNKVFQYRIGLAATYQALVDVATDADDYATQLDAAATVLRSVITKVPGSGVVLGLKWFQNQQSAVRDYYKVNFINGTVSEPKVGQHVLIEGSGAVGDEGIVRYVSVESGSFGADNGAGYVVIEPLNNSFDSAIELYPLRYNKLLPLIEFYFTSGSTEPAVGDVLDGNTSSSTMTVYRIEIQSGAWADGDAAGVIYCTTLSAAFTAAETVDRPTPVATNLMTFDAHLFSTGAGGVMDFQSVDNAGHDRAGLYKTSRAGWQKIDLGWEVRFDTGTNEPVAVVFGADTSSQTVIQTSWNVAGTQRDLTGWAPSAGSELDAVGASAGAFVSPDIQTGSAPIEESEFYFAVHNFDFDIPAGSRIVGVEIRLTARNALSFDTALIQIQPYLNDAAVADGGSLDGATVKRQALGDLTNILVAYAFGGANDLWDAAIDYDMVTDSNFGLKFKFEWDSAGAPADAECDFVEMRIHYVEQGSAVYFYDTVAVADYTEARLVQFNIESGTWAGNDVVGTMQLYGLLRGQIPTKNIQLRDAPAGAGSLIGNLIGSESLPSLPGSALVKAQAAKYQMISENVYARDDLEAIYGVSGAGPAFSYDGFYMRFVRSGLSIELEKPRHVALFQFRLWLGYGFGEMAISVAGNPHSFDGTLNAVATGFGRPITGLVRLAGKTLGVLTDQTTYAVIVDGNDFDQQIFAPKVGAIEYTVQDAGLTPLYADSRGVSTPETTDKYGDYELGRLSHKLHPWLLPRLQGRSIGEVRRDQRVVASTVSRAKNQYRLYFADGYCMTLTLGSEDVQITRQFLYADNLPARYMKVLATDSDIDNTGTDRMFFTMDVNPDYDHGEDLGYVYEDDRGVSYDGAAYKRYVELSPISNGEIHTASLWSTWHLYGMAHGHAILAVTSDTDFAHPADPDDTIEESDYSVILGAGSNAADTKMSAYKDKDRLQRRGSQVEIRIQNESATELQHILQNLTLVTEKKARTER